MKRMETQEDCNDKKEALIYYVELFPSPSPFNSHDSIAKQLTSSTFLA